MKLSIRKLLASAEGFRALSSDSELPAPVAFRVAKLARALDEAFQDFNKQRARILENAEGEEAKAELESLLDEECEIPDIGLSIADLGDIRIRPSHLIDLDWLIED